MDDPIQILDQVRGDLKHWDIEIQDIEVASQSENIVYKVNATEGAFAYRVHRPGYHTLDELNAEHEWTQALADAGFPLPKALPTSSGDYYLPVQVNGSTRYAGVIEWLVGDSMYNLQQDQSSEFICTQLHNLGAMMAQLHKHSEQWQPSSSFTRHQLDVDGFFGKAPFWGRYWESPGITKNQRVLLLETQANIISELKSLGKTNNVYGMIHADLHHGNVHIHNDKMYLIDFDDAGFGWYLYDLAVAHCEYDLRDDFEDLQAALINGYMTERDLSQAHRDLMPLFLHIRTRASIGWATARPELNLAERIKMLIEKTCESALLYRH
jgi:Ser/Thr protein kinase RdoA (MazF antagonist)